MKLSPSCPHKLVFTEVPEEEIYSRPQIKRLRIEGARIKSVNIKEHEWPEKLDLLTTTPFRGCYVLVVSHGRRRASSFKRLARLSLCNCLWSSLSNHK